MTSCPNKKETGLAPKDGERGAALVLVLWFTILFSLIAVSVARIGQTDARIALNMAQVTKAGALADGGVYLAINALLQANSYVGGDFEAWPRDGTAREFLFDDGVVVVSVRDEATKLNPGSASPEAMALAFVELGFSPDEAEALAARIDAVRVESREEARAQRGGGLLSGNQPFLILRDLQWVAGIGDAEYRRVRDAFSLHAPPRRPRPRSVTGPVAGAMTGAPAGMAPDSGVYGITVTAKLPGGTSRERFAVVSTKSGGGQLWKMLEWD